MTRPALVWRDLRALSPLQVAVEITLPVPWLIFALIFGVLGLWYLTVIATFAMFMTGLRVTHNAFHNTVGLSKKGDDWLMFGISDMIRI